MTIFHVRFSLMGALGLAGLLCVAASGWAERIVVADTTHIVAVQTLLLIVAMIYVWQRRWSRVNALSEALIVLGLIGTVVGMIVAVIEIDPSQAGNAAAAGKMAAMLIGGLGIALYTTLVGSVYAIWLWLLQQVLDPSAEGPVA